MSSNNMINNAFADNYTAPNKVSKNLMPAGNFTTNPWQRNVTFTAIADDAYSADRFRYKNIGGGSAVFDVTKNADSPTAAQAKIYSTHCLKFACTTTQSIGAGDTLYFYSAIEGYDFTNIAQRVFTLSFWVKSNLTGTYCVSFLNAGSDRSYVAEYTINSANTWEFKTITVTASPSAGTWNYTNSGGIYTRFTLACGSTFQTTPNSWQTGNFSATSNQVNFASSNTNTIQFALIQVEAGTVATPYELLTQQEVLKYCQRYFTMTFNQGVVPAQASGSLLGSLQYRVRHGAASTTDSLYYRFPVIMRANPTVTMFNPISAASTFYNITNAANSGASVASGAERGVTIRCTQLVTDIAGNLLGIHSTAQAEL